ncbi:dienelactone hydrolase family protein [Candidatus Peregrinibacteria bacterium]|nr:dienelactone hydrolase family protein [Candidatus Peregrinibacteria bacterium]
MKKIFILIVILAALGGGYYYYQQNYASVPTPISTSNNNQMNNSEMLASNKETEITSSEVEYSPGIKGLYATPTAPGNYPGIVIMHEWWGLNDNIKDMARQLAKEGYRVVAVDLYHGEVATTSERANELRTALKQDEANKNMQDAIKFLQDQGITKIASLGWCFGGGQSLQLALSGQKLDATVIYYGQLTSDEEQLNKIQWPVLGIFGAKDTSITPEQVGGFETALNNLSIKNEIHIYPDVGHAFANPSGQNYAPEATKDAWEKTMAFLKTNLQ